MSGLHPARFLDARFWLILACVASFSVPAAESVPGDAGIDWQRWSAEVFDRARRENRLVLVDLTAEWCAFCRTMDAVTYRDAGVVEEINRSYIAVRADEAEQPELGRRYAEYGRPATVIFDGAGTEIIKRRGYIKPQFMVWLLQAVADDPSPEAHR